MLTLIVDAIGILTGIALGAIVANWLSDRLFRTENK
jgi:hypothetical protein